MGKKDDCLKWYLGNETVFADFCNGVLYGGKKMILPQNLAERQRFYREELRNRTGGKQRPGRERDVAKLLCRAEGFVMIAVENQNDVNLCMPLRCMEYDLEDLLRQIRWMKRRYKREGGLEAGVEFLSGIKRTDRLIPTVTMVLFHGEGKWDAAKNLQEMMNLDGMDETLKKLLPEYKLHVIHLTELDENKFETGLRELIGMMKHRNSREEMQTYCRENADRFESMDDHTYDVICTMLNMKSLEERKESCRSQERSRINMCKAFEDWAKEERAKGKKEGKKEGIEIGEKRGEKRLSVLIARLMEEERIEDVKRVVGSLTERRKLYQEFGI